MHKRTRRCTKKITPTNISPGRKLTPSMIREWFIYCVDNDKEEIIDKVKERAKTLEQNEGYD